MDSAEVFAEETVSTDAGAPAKGARADTGTELAHATLEIGAIMFDDGMTAVST